MDTSDEPPGNYSTFAFRFAAEVMESVEPLTGVSISVYVAVLIVGLLFSAIYSGAEVAFFSMINQLDKLDRDQKPGGRDHRIIKMLEKPRRLLATVLIGNTFSNVVSSVVAAILAGHVASLYGLPEFAVFTVEVIVLTFMILILSEITPKIIAINEPLKYTRRLSGFIYVNFILFTPVSRLFADSAVVLEKYLPKPQSKMTTDDLKAMAEVGEMSGSIKGDEREIIENVIEFGYTTVREIMTSRVNIVAVSMENTMSEVVELIRTEGLSRMPLYENDLDSIHGVIYAKDILPYLNSDMEKTVFNWRSIARKTLFIPATKKLDDLLRDFQHEKTHLAVVVDEYGGTEGLVTLDDILEEIVGEIGDEYDDNEEKLFTQFKNGVFIFDAKIDLDDMEEILECKITTPDDEFETLGGLVYHLTERIPNVGELITYREVEMRVHSVKNNRVKKLRVKVIPKSGPAQESNRD